MQYWQDINKCVFPLSDWKKITYKKEKYVDIPMSFDIETSSFYLKNGKSYTNKEVKELIAQNAKVESDFQKASVCYIWQFAISLDWIFYGRDLCDFVEFLRILHRKLNGYRAIIYVHNLSYEFQFIRKYFDFLEVFAIENRKVLYAKTALFDFRCSYMLSAKSLSGVSREIANDFSNIAKKDGDLNYDLVRHNKTPLTEKEMEYCAYDVLTVNAYIFTQMHLYGNITKLPLTNTGRVRRLVRKNCFKQQYYNAFIHRLTLDSLEFKMARFAFNGGYVHCSPLYVNEVCENVSSYDFTSSYPYVMISERYPMSKGFCYPKEKLTIEIYEKYCENHLAMSAVSFERIKVKDGLQAIISSSKCMKVENCQYDNGKVWKADKIALVATNIELKNIKAFYDFEKIEIGTTYFYKADYLPKPFIETILDLYKAKTQLKGLKGKDDEETLEIEKEYMLKKNMLNSLYGMTVYNPLKDEAIYDNEWIINKTHIDDTTIGKINSDKQRFSFYLWGVFVTSYARNNLFSALLECKTDFVYSDTDSVKLFNREKHINYFKEYDTMAVEKMLQMCKKYEIDFNECQPENVKGDKKLLGIWDYEGDYDRFKSLGAKRYLTEKDGDLSLTVSGVNSHKALPYLKEKYKTNEKIFEAFTHSLYIPSDYTGKSIHSYIDDECDGCVTDYLGNEKDFKTLSGVHLSESDYSLSLLEDFRNFFRFIKSTHS